MIGTKQLDPEPPNLQTQFSYLINMTLQISRPLEQPTSDGCVETKVNRYNAIQFIDTNPNWLEVRYTYNCIQNIQQPPIGRFAIIFKQNPPSSLRTKPWTKFANFQILVNSAK